MLVLNINYLFTYIRYFTNYLVLEQVNVRHDKVCNGNIEIVAWVIIHDTFSRHDTMSFGHIWMRNYIYYACRFCRD